MTATLTEERVTNAPRRSMKFPPLDPGKPVTNKQLADQNQRLHDCLHNVGERVDKLTTTVSDDREETREREQLLDVRIARMEGALGVRLPSPEAMEAGEPPKPVGRKLAGLSVWQAAGAGALTVIGAMSGFQLLYQWLVPAIWAAMKILHANIMGG